MCKTSRLVFSVAHAFVMYWCVLTKIDSELALRSVSKSQMGQETHRQYTVCVSLVAF